MTYLTSSSNVVKSCKNCGYRENEVCLKSGYYWAVTRKLSQEPSSVCDENFSGWAPQPVQERGAVVPTAPALLVLAAILIVLVATLQK